MNTENDVVTQSVEDMTAEFYHFLSMERTPEVEARIAKLKAKLSPISMGRNPHEQTMIDAAREYVRQSRKGKEAGARRELKPTTISRLQSLVNAHLSLPSSGSEE